MKFSGLNIWVTIYLGDSLKKGMWLSNNMDCQKLSFRDNQIQKMVLNNYALNINKKLSS